MGKARAAGVSGRPDSVSFDVKATYGLTALLALSDAAICASNVAKRAASDFNKRCLSASARKE